MHRHMTDDPLEVSGTLAGTAGRANYAQFLIDFVRKYVPPNGVILEIGTQVGGSAITMALTQKAKGSGGMIHCIDPAFVPLKERPDKYRHYPIGSPVADFIYKKATEHGIRDNITLHPGLSEEVLQVWKPGKIFDMIYIDGDHTYSSIKIDMQWEQYAKEKCIIVLDDWIKPVAKAAMECMAGKEYQFYIKPMAHFMSVAWLAEEIEERKKKNKERI